uniref:Large-conductance Ca2+-activated K+ channel beta2 subunit n=1 Tax=Rattus norvegicus TaxID=10116 RepID=B5BNW4_RAT|nr:large-conductance Ca2+-activated K+ channel beta2 subunit [Rattus norvegicus]
MFIWTSGRTSSSYRHDEKSAPIFLSVETTLRSPCPL